MKTLLTTLSILLSLTIFSQNCDEILPLNEGTQWSYQSFDKKGKLSSTATQKIVATSESGGTVTASIKQELVDDKEKPINTSEYDVSCDGNQINISIEKMMNEEMMASFKGMEVKVDADQLDYYSNPTVGQNLKDATMVIDVATSGTETAMGMSMLKMTVNITNRKVEAKETVTTAAGTFECYKITYDIEMKTIVKVQAKAVEWFCPGVGMVKQESYNKNGKFTGSSELSELIKG
jgi:hypothetical protein